MSWINRLRNLVRPLKLERELDDEIRFHLDARVRDNKAEGMSEAEARRDAQKRFGNRTLLQEQTRDTDIFRWLHNLSQDLRYAFRGFRTNPGFTCTAVVSLALGIGANSAIFSALDAALWKPLPVADPQTLVNFSITRAQGDDDETDLPAAFAHQLRDSGIFRSLIVSSSDGLSFSYNDGPAERVIGQIVSPDYFRALGVLPILGRDFSEQQHGRWAAEAVLSYSFWRRRFGGDPGIIGRTIRLNTYPFTVVGIQPPSFFGVSRGSDYELRIPFLPDGQELKQIKEIDGLPARWLGTVARLKPGQTLAQAEAAADAQLQTFLQTTPIEEFREAGLHHLRLSPGARGDSERTLQFAKPLYVLMVLVGIVLLIACANVASMLLARATARSRELSIRASIGASRGRLLQQLLTEGLLLSFIGGGVGVLVAYSAASLIVGFIPDGHVSIVLDLHPDNRVLLFTFAIAALTGILSGLVPALQASKGMASAVLRSATTSLDGNRGNIGLRRILIISQVAFSLLLLVAADTFVHTLADLRPSDLHMNPNRVLVFTLKPQREIYSEQQRLEISEELVRRAAQIPGVQSTALAEYGPLGTRLGRSLITAPGGTSVRADTDQVTPGFFSTIGLPLLSGRDFTDRDTSTTAPVAVIDQGVAHALFPNQSPLGRTFYTGPQQHPRGPFQIVGVTASARYYDLHKAPQPLVWFAIRQQPPFMPTLHVTLNDRDVPSVIVATRQIMARLAPGVPMFNIRTMDSRIQDSMMQERMIANLSGGFGALAIALTAVGLYGILAYSVLRRTKEIGIRRALGSSAASILWLIVREAVWLVSAGSIVGVTIAIEASHLWSRYFTTIHPVTPSIFGLCIAAMLLLSSAAAMIPSLRACHVDPLSSLRHE